MNFERPISQHSEKRRLRPEAKAEHREGLGEMLEVMFPQALETAKQSLQEETMA